MSCSKLIILSSIILSLFFVAQAEAKTRQLLKNGGFEKGENYWEGDGEIYKDANYAKKGDYYGSAWAGSNEYVHLYQEVKIPKKAKKLRLSFWYMFHSWDVLESSEDNCGVNVYKQDGDSYNFYLTEIWFPQNDQVEDWTRYKTTLPVGDMKGHEVKVEFYCTADLFFDSWIYFDRVKLKAKI